MKLFLYYKYVDYELCYERGCVEAKQYRSRVVLRFPLLGASGMAIISAWGVELYYQVEPPPRNLI